MKRNKRARSGIKAKSLDSHVNIYFMWGLLSASSSSRITIIVIIVVVIIIIIIMINMIIKISGGLPNVIGVDVTRNGHSAQLIIMIYSPSIGNDYSLQEEEIFFSQLLGTQVSTAVGEEEQEEVPLLFKSYLPATWPLLAFLN